MPQYEIEVKQTFCAAHALRLPDGSLETLHGHNWQVMVTVQSGQLDAMDTVMDFHELERWLDALMAQVNNGNLNTLPPFADGSGGLAINPSAERVAQWIGEDIAAKLPESASLVSVRVSEAPGCRATFRP